MQIVEKQIRNFDNTEFARLRSEIDKARMNKDNKEIIIIFHSNDYQMRWKLL
jgi:hypothetical protein